MKFGLDRQDHKVPTTTTKISGFFPSSPFYSEELGPAFHLKRIFKFFGSYLEIFLVCLISDPHSSTFYHDSYFYKHYGGIIELSTGRRVYDVIQPGALAYLILWFNQLLFVLVIPRGIRRAVNLVLPVTRSHIELRGMLYISAAFLRVSSPAFTRMAASLMSIGSCFILKIRRKSPTDRKIYGPILLLLTATYLCVQVKSE